MAENKIYPVKESMAMATHATDERYQAMYRESIERPNEFWAAQADLHVDWYEKWNTVSDVDYQQAHIRWF